MKSLCLSCEKPAIVICKCSNQSFCADCYGDHEAETTADHEPEGIVEAGPPIAVPPVLKKRQAQAVHVAAALKALSEELQSVVSIPEEMPDAIEIFARDNADSDTAPEDFNDDLGKSLSTLETKITAAYRQFLASLDVSRAAIPPPTSPNSQLTDLQQQVLQLTDENDHLRYQLNLLKRDQWQQSSEIEKLKERASKLSEESERLREGNHGIMMRLRAVEDENEAVKTQRNQAQAALLALKQRTQFLEEERKVQTSIAPPPASPLTTPRCTHCKGVLRADTTGWRTVALSETPEAAGMASTVCSIDCFRAVRTGPSLFARLVRK